MFPQRRTSSPSGGAGTISTNSAGDRPVSMKPRCRATWIRASPGKASGRSRATRRAGLGRRGVAPLERARRARRPRSSARGSLAMLAALRAVPHVAPLMFTRSPVPSAFGRPSSAGPLAALPDRRAPPARARGARGGARRAGALGGADAAAAARARVARPAGGRSTRAVSPAASARCSVCSPRDAAPTRSRAISRSRAETVRGHVKSVLRKLGVRTLCGGRRAARRRVACSGPDG